jgi:hypothetical protein
MDTISHALYGGLVCRSKKKFILCCIFGALPDLMLATLSPVKAVKIFFTPGSSLPEYYIYYYRLLHSFFTAGLIYLLIFLFNKKYRFLVFPYVLHILIDIPTHNGRFATRFLYPLSNVAIQGYSYIHHSWIWVANFVILVILYLWCYYKTKHVSQTTPSPQSSRS